MSKQPSVMAHDFSRAPEARINRSKFNRSHGHKTTFNSGELVPILVDEVLPGDTFNCNVDAFGRLATPIFPIMDNSFLDTFFFAVPVRLLWDNWERFNGAQDKPGDSIDFTVPVVDTPTGGHSVGSLYDYFGIPTGVENLSVNNLHGRAYNLIYNEWFRDQNLIDPAVVDTGDANDDPANYVIRRRGKRHDYFTSCLPWPQKGDAVDLPLGDRAPIATDADVQERLSVYSSTQTGDRAMDTDGSNYVKLTGSSLPDMDPLYADLTSATAATINQLREAFQIQGLLERDARGGTRYTEIIKSHFGVTSPDSRMQRPEYLGGGSTPLNVNAIAQTSSTDSTSPQGNLAAMGTVQVRGHGFAKSFTEHCVIIGLVSVRADLNYQQGLNRMWSRQTRYDFYYPALANLGEQAVLSKEIYADGSADDDTVFGYQERYAEYRYKPSIISGQFRSTYAQSLDAWHLAQKFDDRPVLSEEFIRENPPFERVLAVQDTDYPQFIFDSYFHYYCDRPMPTYAVPGLISHF